MSKQAYSKKRFTVCIRLMGVLVLGCSAVLGSAPVLAQGLATLDAIVAAHGVNRLAPLSVQMTGIVDRGGKPESFRLLGTRDEERRIEYGTSGTDTRVTTSKLTFHDNGEKTTTGQSGSGFSQLDVTGLFLVEQLRNRAVRVDLSEEWALVGGVRARRVRVSSERSYKIPGRVRVDDRLDLYVTESGLLAGISRTLYEGRPERYTATWIFSDYREIQDKMRLPHRIELYVNNKKRETFAVETYAFDVPANRDLFLPRRSR